MKSKTYSSKSCVSLELILFFKSWLFSRHKTGKYFFSRSITFSVNKKIILHLIEPGLTKTLNLSNAVVIGKGFTGQLTDLNMWSRPLTLPELDQFQDCDASFGSESRIVDWSITNVTFDPDLISVERFQVQEVCQVSPRMKFFPLKMSFKAALKVCQNLEGKMFLPRNEIGTIGSEHLATSYDGQIWIPVVRSENNSWLIQNNTYEEVDLGNVANSDSSDSCVIESEVGFSVESCDAERCFVCELHRSPVIKFRGQCASSNLFDFGYVFDPEGDTYLFRGFSGTRQLKGNIGKRSKILFHLLGKVA